MFQLKTLSQPATSTTEEIEWRSFPMPKVKKWLRRTHIGAYALGVATVLWVQHYAPADPKANAATPSATVVTAPAAASSGK